MKRVALILFPAALLGLLGLVYTQGWAEPIARKTREALDRARSGPEPIAPVAEEPSGPTPGPGGTVVVPEDRREAIGLRTAAVAAQVEPLRIELPGTTADDPDTLSKVRPRFDALVREVFVSIGQAVRRGDPLVALYSATLAEAKTAFEIAETQWDHDRRLLKTREPLVKDGAISQQLWADTQNAEIQSRLAFKVARDKLLVYGLDDEQIDAIDGEDGAAKAELTIRSPADGVVIDRDVVSGNLYGLDDVLLTITPLDHLWVWGNVYERDLDLVRSGLRWEVTFPYLHQSVSGRVDYVGNRVDPGTRAVRIRGTIDNPDGRYKADMLVRTFLEIPPDEGNVVVPRVALVTTDGAEIVFVGDPDDPSRFARRPVEVAHEYRDRVVIKSGLAPGEVIVTDGSLLLANVDAGREAEPSE